MKPREIVVDLVKAAFVVLIFKVTASSSMLIPWNSTIDNLCIVFAICVTFAKLCRLTSGILEDPAPAVYLSNYKESSIEYKIFCWCSAEAYWDVYFGLGENLRTAFAENGVEMTYDHLNVHIIEKA